MGTIGLPPPPMLTPLTSTPAPPNSISGVKLGVALPLFLLLLGLFGLTEARPLLPPVFALPAPLLPPPLVVDANRTDIVEAIVELQLVDGGLAVFVMTQSNDDEAAATAVPPRRK